MEEAEVRSSKYLRISRFLSSSLVFLLVGAAWLQADDTENKLDNLEGEPTLISVFPLGARQGSVLEVEIRGRNLTGVQAIWFDAAGLSGQIKTVDQIKLEEKGGALTQVTQENKTRPGHRVLLQLEIGLSTRCGSYLLRLVSPRGISNALPFLVSTGSISSASETSTSHRTPAEAQPLDIPVIVNGRIAEKGELDYYSFEAVKGQALSFNIFSTIPVGGVDAAEIALYELAGSWFDPQRLTRLASYASRRVVADPIPGIERMPGGLTYRFSHRGRYYLEVGTTVGIGGPDSFYELLIVPEERSILSEEQWHRAAPIWQERAFDRKLEPNRLQVLWARTLRIGQDVTSHAPSVPRIAPSSALPDSKGTATSGDSSDDSLDLPVFPLKKIGPDDKESLGSPVAVPVLLEGTIDRPGKVDNFMFKVNAGQQLAFEIETPDAKPFEFLPRLAIHDSNGQEILANLFRRVENQFWMRSIEPKTVFTFDKGGDYTLQIRDLTARYGDFRFKYRVVIRRQIPHIGRIEVKEDHINLLPGEAKKLTVVAEQEEGFTGEIVLEVDNLPSHVQVFTSTEAEPEKKERTFEGAEGKKEYFRARSRKAALMLVAGTDAPSSTSPVLLRISARPVVGGKLGEPLVVGNIPMMVVKPALMSSASGLPAQDNH